MNVATLYEAVEVRGRFHRSVQIAKDWRNLESLENYLLTPTVRGLVGRIMEELEVPGGTRAWSVTGPYGSGKSSFALFLADLLAGDPPRHHEARPLRDELGVSEEATFLPVLVVGQRGPVKPAALRVLAESVERLDPFLAREIAAAALQGSGSDEETVSWFERAADAAHQAGMGGLLVVLDEFGKFLEYAALHPETEDLFFMQQLAEAASRNSYPMVLVTLLHTAFTEYLHSSADESRRAEWRKVQGRFADVAFQEPPEQLLRLVGSAVVRQVPEDIEVAYERIVEEAIRSEAFFEARRRLPLEELLFDCLPLDPTVALLLWPVFRGKLAQNERSLFNFLTGREPFGFEEFLSLSVPDRDRPPVYRLDRLYDYVTTALGAGAHRGESGRRWTEIDQALRRISGDAPPLAAATVKALGVLGAYGPAVGLRASEETLSLSLGDREAVREALEYLVKASIAIYRRHEGAYGLWEGSDVDLDERYEEALQHLGGGALAERLGRAVTLRPVVARAHYVETGTLRYLQVGLLDGNEPAIREALTRDVPADGGLYYVVCRSEERAFLIEAARELTQEASLESHLRIFAFPEPMTGLEEALEEVEAWRWVEANERALQGDPVARKELRSRLLYAQRRLEEIAGRVLGLRGYRFDPAASAWVQGGASHTPRSAREFSRWLSELCDEVYAEAPALQNELLNRDRLSSAAAKARRNLLEGMLECRDRHRLGFEGTPAEVSMYEALLARGGFHAERDGEWRFGEPDGDWKLVWSAIEEFLFSATTDRRPVGELFDLLRCPPYGLRQGPLPILLCAVLLARRSDVALYDDGVFVPELTIELFERILRSPEGFELRRFVLTDKDRGALDAAGQVVSALQPQPELVDASNIVETVRPMIMLAARLPAYAKRTKRLDPPPAVALRDALLRARDPYELLFTEIPTALGVSLDSSDEVPELAKALRECLLGLQRAYPRLLDEIERDLRMALDLHGSAEEARHQLQWRATPLVDYVGGQTTGIFVREAASLGDKDWREALARALNGGIPPYEWRDRDLVGFQVRLQEVASDFVRLEELVAEKQRAGGDSQIFRIGILDGRVREARELLAVTPERSPRVEDLAVRIAETLEQHSGNGEEGRRTQLAALAKVAMERLRADGRDRGN